MPRHKIEVQRTTPDGNVTRTTTSESVRHAAVMYAHQEAQEHGVTRVEVWAEIDHGWRRILLYDLMPEA